jgi:glycosyltransferase involved in cell wall biosynthesis
MLSHRSVAIDFLGRVDEAVKPAIFQQSDLVCVPSSVELQSVVALEAFAARRPVLAASVGALTELVVHGRTGSLFSPNDVLDLAAKIREFGQMPRKQRTTMAFAAAAEVQELHSNTLMLDGYSSLYARIAAQK